MRTHVPKLEPASPAAEPAGQAFAVAVLEALEEDARAMLAADGRPRSTDFVAGYYAGKLAALRTAIGLHRPVVAAEAPKPVTEPAWGDDTPDTTF